MKKMIGLIAGMLLCATTAYADFWTGSVYNNSLGAFVPNIMGLDWSSSGSGLIQGLASGSAPQVGQNVDFLYQASLVGVTGPLGNPVAFPGLNTSFEYTVVAKLPETIISVTEPTPGVFSTVIKTNPGGEFAIYNQMPNDSNVPTGTGFNNGTRVVMGTINPGQITTFTSTSFSPLTGIGSTILEGLVTSIDPLFFNPAITIFDFRFEGTVNAPPLDSTTASFFDGNDGFAVTPVTADGTLVKTDGSSKFSVVPEPSTFLLLGIGLLGVAGYTRKKMQN